MAKNEIRFIPPIPQPGQEQYFDSLKENTITLVTGLAGVGKTFLALAVGIEKMLNSSKRGGIQRIVIIRPYIRSATGEDLGALPGDLDEKVTPYVQSIKDNLRQLFNNEQEIDYIIRNKIEFTVLSMCRGRSFHNSYIIVEEAQNVPVDGDAMLMILTRLGKESKLVIGGDLDQCDLPLENSAMVEAINALSDTPGIGVISMDNIETIQRSPMVKTILKKYKEYRGQDID
jgi:phosphate starvation-inducible protein PhoH and related proteins